MLACWVEDPNGDNFKKHLARIPDFIWVAEDGIKMQVRKQVNSITNLPNSCRKIRKCLFIFFLKYFKCATGLKLCFYPFPPNWF